MTEFNSPLGRKTVSGPGRKILTVEDPTFEDTAPLPDPQYLPMQNMRPGMEVELTPEQFNQFQNRKRELQAAQKRPAGEAKRRIEFLVGIGSLTREAMVGDKKFVLRSLKSKEMREVIASAAKVEMQSEVIFELRAQTLARSLVSIDNNELELLLGDDSLEARLEFINNSEEHVVNKLYAVYSEMVAESERRFGVKTEAEAEEVLKDIKK